MAPGSVGGFFASKSMDAMFEELVGSNRDGNLTAAGLKSWLTEQHQRIKGSSTEAHHSNNATSDLFTWAYLEMGEVRAFLCGGRPPLEAIDDDSNPVLVEKEDAILENLVLSKPGLQRLLRFFFCAWIRLERPCGRQRQRRARCESPQWGCGESRCGAANLSSDRH